MAIKGYIERISPRFISGWCADEQGEDSIELEVRVEGLSLGTVRADIYRPDIEKGLNRPLAGFRFPISPELLRLLPHRGRVEVITLAGQTLPTLKGIDSWIDNRYGQDINKLAEMFRNGYMVNPKYGQVILPIKERNIEDQIFEALEVSNQIFEAQCSKSLFICYGTLLGCIRNNDFIPHDEDVDVCFLADGPGLDAAAREFRQTIRKLTDIGQRIVFDSGTQFHWHVQETWLDVFMGWIEGENLYMYNAGGVFSRNQIYPLVEHDFKGHQVLIPNDAEALLELIYGPRWHIPDPSFQWREPKEVRAKMDEINAVSVRDSSTHNENEDHWAQFYERAHTNLPSPFAASVAIELKKPAYIIDLGCGNGRDSFFFAGLGHRVIGLDFCAKAIDDNTRRTREQGINDVEFKQVDISSPNALVNTLDLIEEIAIQEGDSRRDRVAIYARFFFHAISEEEEELVLAALSKCLRPEATCFFEFRTEKDIEVDKRFGSHYRRFINVDEFVQKATVGRPIDCFYQVEGQGMAKYFEEDPYVGRVFLRRV